MPVPFALPVAPWVLQVVPLALFLGATPTELGPIHTSGAGDWGGARAPVHEDRADAPGAFPLRPAQTHAQGEPPAPAETEGEPPPAPGPLPPAVPPAPLADDREDGARWRITGPLEPTLRRVIRTGCREGFADLQAGRAALGEADPLIDGVLSLCTSIRREGLAPLGEVPPEAGLDDRRGRSRLVLASTLYGLWLGVATNILFDVGDADERWILVPPALGMAAGLAGSFWATRRGEISVAQAWSIITGLDYGSYLGLFFALGAAGETNTVVATAVASGLAGGVLGATLAYAVHPSHGAVEMVRSGGLWGAATGLLTMGLIQPRREETVYYGIGSGVALGLGTGALLARLTPVSPNRMLLLDAGMLAGGVLGFGTAWFFLGGLDTDADGRIASASALAGLGLGLAAAVYFTQELGATAPQERVMAPLPALVSRTAEGRWVWGLPPLAPLWGPLAGTESLVVDGGGTLWRGGRPAGLQGTFAAGHW